MSQLIKEIRAMVKREEEAFDAKLRGSISEVLDQLPLEDSTLTGVNEAFVSQPALVAYVATQRALHRQQADRARLDLKVAEATISASIRTKAAAKGEKTTEKSIEEKLRKTMLYKLQRLVGRTSTVNNALAL